VTNSRQMKQTTNNTSGVKLFFKDS